MTCAVIEVTTEEGEILQVIVVCMNYRPLYYTSATIHLTACVFTVLESSLHYHLIGT